VPQRFRVLTIVKTLARRRRLSARAPGLPVCRPQALAPAAVTTWPVTQCRAVAGRAAPCSSSAAPHSASSSGTLPGLADGAAGEQRRAGLRPGSARSGGRGGRARVADWGGEPAHSPVLACGCRPGRARTGWLGRRPVSIAQVRARCAVVAHMRAPSAAPRRAGRARAAARPAAPGHAPKVLIT